MTIAYMRPSVLVGFVFLMTLGAACVDDRLNDPEADGAPANRAHEPFYVAVFDHVPDEGEIQADFERFLLESKETSTAGTYDPVPKQDPIVGQKLVRIDARTGTQDNSGTGDGSEFTFRGRWENGSGTIYAHEFRLGEPGEPLGQGTVSVFYYLLDVPYTADRPLRGRVETFSTNGWYCVEINLYETNHRADTRRQRLPFGQWLDYPGNSSSDWLPASDSSLLYYR